MSNATKPTALTDETGIPLKWAFAIVGAAVGLLLATAVGLIFLGGLTTRLANAEKGVQDSQLDSRERNVKDVALEGRLGVIEGKIDILLERVK